MTNRITNVSALAMAIETLTEQGFDTEALAKLSNIKASLEKKSAKSGERKPTATQLANEKLKVVILDSMADNTVYTVTQIVKLLPEEYTVSKVSALLQQLLKANLVVNTKEKGKSYYTKA